MLITFLFVTKTSSMGIHFLSKNLVNIFVPNYFGLLFFSFLHFQHLLFAIDDTLHVAYKKYRIFFFSFNTKCMSSQTQ